MTGYQHKIRIVSVRLRLAVLGRCLLLLSVVSVSEHSLADQSGVTTDIFLPNQYAYYNPLKHGAKHKSDFADRRTQMDNASLLRAAEHIRSTSMSAEQRALNHQWLMHAEDEDSIRVGGKVFSALMRMGFKTYWEVSRANADGESRVIPDGEGDGKFSEDIDYKLRLSGDKIKLSVEYEF